MTSNCMIIYIVTCKYNKGHIMGIVTSGVTSIKKNAIPTIGPVLIHKKNITVPIMARIIYYKTCH